MYAPLQKFYSRLKGFPSLTYVLAIFISYYLIQVYRFCHPFEKTLFYSIFYLGFFFSFLPSLYNRKSGRIFTVLGAFLWVRVGHFAGLETPMYTLAGVFLGGLCGSFLRQIFVSVYRHSAKEEDPILQYFYRNGLSRSTVSSFLQPKLGFILLLLIILLERFLVYFDSPYLRDFPVLETMYTTTVSSKMAFALSVELLTGLLFPLLYFWAEESTAPEVDPIHRHFRTGLILALVVQFVILFVQNVYRLEVFSQGSNLSLVAGRAPGLFRDSGSASWILPTLSLYLMVDSWRRPWKKRSRFLIITFVFILTTYIGFGEGKAFWLIWIPSSLFFLAWEVWRYFKNLWIRIATPVATLILLFCFVFGVFYWGKAEKAPAVIIKLSDTMDSFSDSISAGEWSLDSVDPARADLLSAAWTLIGDHWVFGSGVGSFITHLKDPSIEMKRPAEGFVDSPPSFYAGALAEWGIVGLVGILLWIGMEFYLRRVYWVAGLLLLPFLTGYQIVHSDGAFFVILLLVGLTNVKFKFPNSYYAASGNLILSVLALAILLHSALVLSDEPRPPEFRYKNIRKYQLLAYEVSKSTGPMRHHTFRGKSAWIISHGGDIVIRGFLDESTSKAELFTRWSFLDENWKEITSRTWTLSHTLGYERLSVPLAAKYLQFQELNLDGTEVSGYGNTPISISVENFDSLNRVR